MVAKEGCTWTPERARYCGERAVIGLLITIIWGLFALPTAMYFLPQNTTLEDEVSMSQLQANASDTTFQKYTGDFGNETGSDNISRVDMNFSIEIECSEDFYLEAESGLCRPECGEWEEFPHSTVLAVDVVTILQAVVFFISATVFLLMSCIRYRRMFRFPTVFIIYGTIAVGVVELFLLIGYFDRKVLFCSSCDIIESIMNTATFCTIQGLIVNYVVLVIPIFSLFHIAVVAWAINFPFQAQASKSKGHFKYIHTMMIFVALVLPFGSVAAAFSNGGYGILRFPPILCFPRSVNVILYGMILPVSVMIASEISLLVIIFWVVIKFVYKQRKQNHNATGLKATMKTQLHMNTAELKVLIVFIYYAVSGASLLAISAVIRRVPLFIGELVRYSMCEADGVNSGLICERPFERFSTEIPVDVYLVLQGKDCATGTIQLERNVLIVTEKTFLLQVHVDEELSEEEED